MTLYVIRNLGRDIDFSSGENETMSWKIERYWSLFIKSNDGTEQLVKCRSGAANNLIHSAPKPSKRDLDKNDNDRIITPITTVEW